MSDMSRAVLPTAILATAVLILSGCVINVGEDSSESPATTEAPTTDAPDSSPDPTPQPTDTVAAPPSVPATYDPVDPATAEPIGQAPQWADVISEVSTGVVSLATGVCEGPGSTGSGFLVADDLVVTNQHVIDMASEIKVGSAAVPAEILGTSIDADLALLRLTEPVDGHVFSWVDQTPELAQDVAVIGYPLSGGLSVHEGTVSNLNPDYPLGGELARYLQTTAAINPGNSGGPMVTSDGSVAGVVTARYSSTDVDNVGFVLSHQTAEFLLDDWAATPEPVELEVCDGEESTDASVEVVVTSEHEDAPAIAQSLALHGEGINRSMYDAAFAYFTPDRQRHYQSAEAWSAGLLTTLWRWLVVEDVTRDGDVATVRVELLTTQSASDGPDGLECSVWSMDYTMVPNADTWLIDRAKTVAEPHECRSQ